MLAVAGSQPTIFGIRQHMGLLARSMLVFGQLGRGMFIGTIVLLLAVAAGWVLGRHTSFPLVRLITWWVTRVVTPLLRSRSWVRRAATIFINNTCVLAALLALGPWRIPARVGVVLLGLSLGIALRHLSAIADRFAVSVPVRDRSAKRRMRVGVALNLLEPPAIVLTLGLTLGFRTIPLTGEQAWLTFGVWVVPTLFVAAAGEALWLGVGQTENSSLGEADADIPRPSAPR